MGRLPLLIVILAADPGRAEPPALFHEQAFNCATLAAAVNHYVGHGEAAAVKELEGLALDWRADFKGEFSRNERIGWVCRILFEPKGADPLNPPAFGGLSLPHGTMPLTNWPCYPVAAAGSTYFVLSEGYLLAGVAEPAKGYLTYCRTTGKFRTKPVGVPTRAQALRDADTLRSSDAWKAIKWADSGPGFSYKFSEKHTWDYIRGQAERIPVK